MATIPRWMLDLLNNPKTAKFAESLRHSDLPSGWANDPEIVGLAERAYQQGGTESPFFKAWFGRSNALDGDGKPLALYHGSGSAGFSSFSDSTKGATTAAPSAFRGHFFSSSPNTANFYAGFSPDEAFYKTLEENYNKAFDRYSDAEKFFYDALEKTYKAAPWEPLPPLPLDAGEVTKAAEEIVKARSIPPDDIKEAMQAAKNYVAENATAQGAMTSAIKDLFPDFNTLYGSFGAGKGVSRAEGIINDLAWENIKKNGGWSVVSPEMQEAAEKIYDTIPEVERALRDKWTLESTINNARAKDKALFIRESVKNNDKNALDSYIHGKPGVYPVYLKEDNPLTHDFSGTPYRDASYNDLLEQAASEGKDSAVFKNTFDPFFSDIHIVFDPAQIKGIFNRGTFDPADPNIMRTLVPLGIGVGTLAAAGMLPEDAEAATTAPESRDWLRRVGLGARNVLEGVTAIPQDLANLVNGAFGGDPEYFGNAGAGIADFLGLPAAETDNEKLLSAIIKGVSEGALPVGGATRLALLGNGALGAGLETLGTEQGQSWLQGALQGIFGGK